MTNEFSENLSLNDVKARYDAQCKRVLSQKEILAWILARTVKEFKGMSVEEIIPCIEGTPEVSSIPVDAGKTNVARIYPEKAVKGKEHQPERIVGMTNEDAVPDEGEIYYDIRFYANIPGGQGVIRLIINLEAQKSYYPGYEIVTRGIFYSARMISAQLGTEFTHSGYNDIKKVYSIWICMDAPKKVGNAIAEYRLQKHDILPGIPDKPEAYDKISIVMINLSDKAETEDGLLDMLNLLFSDKITYHEKKEKLEEKYQLHMSDQLGKEMHLMCNLSDLVEVHGIQQGIQQGMKRGVQSGIQRGRKYGMEEKSREIAKKLLKLGTMSEEEILQVTEISKEQLDKIKETL